MSPVKLYAFGSNGSGQLGLGHDEDVSIPTRCLFDVDGQGQGQISASGVDESGVDRIVAGGNHTLVLFSSGAVYAAGCDADGRCGIYAGGRGCSEESVVRFRRVTVGDEKGSVVGRFKDVSATWEGTFLVAGERENEHEPGGDGDRVFVLGSGVKGELGLGDGITSTKAVAPARIPDFPPRGAKVVSIASGMGHTVAVLSNGEVYGWGGARKGQLGDSVKPQKVIWSPVKIEGVSFHASSAVCGREFTVITGDKAAGEFVVLGSPDDKWGILSEMPEVASLTDFRRVLASWHGIYVHKGDGSVVSWGRNDRGQLPPGNLPRAAELAVGSEHTLVLVDGQTVLAFGWGEHGNCGPVTDEKGNVQGTYQRIPLPVDEHSQSRVLGVGAGCATSWIVMS